MCQNVEVIVIFWNKIKVKILALLIHTCSRKYMCIFMRFKQFSNFKANIKRNRTSFFDSLFITPNFQYEFTVKSKNQQKTKQQQHQQTNTHLLPSENKICLLHLLKPLPFSNFVRKHRIVLIKNITMDFYL